MNSVKVFDYLQSVLPQTIIESNAELRDKVISDCVATNSKSLDGFMSAIFTLHLQLSDKKSNRDDVLNLIVKMMKNNAQFRELTNADSMNINELKFYQEILPVFKNLYNAEFNLTPKFYYGFYGMHETLGNGEDPEGIFVFENLIASGYRLGKRENLDEQHIMLMAEAIAKFHAVSYAMKIDNKSGFDAIVESLKVIPFYKEKRNMNDVFFDITLDRLHGHVTKTSTNEGFVKSITELHSKYIEKPSKLMQLFLERDPLWSVLVHGDYNRNNVMFQYDLPDGFENPKQVKMFDFQLIKYGSPALDLSFFMFMNMHDIIEDLWDRVLELYFKTLMTTIASILNCKPNDDRLKGFTYESFTNHFSSFAFYGLMITAWFLPVMLSDLERCALIESEMEKDAFSKEAKEVTMPAGGKQAIDIVTKVTEFAYRRGYMKRLL